MIFGSPLFKMVLCGKKTVTRRRVKGYDDKCRYKVGRTYAVQAGRGFKGAGRIEILSVKKEHLWQISTQGEHKKEGFNSLEEFFGYWTYLYKKIDLDTSVWRIEFKVVSDKK